MRTKRNRKGFTLAELLIVVAIIAVLVAIAIPVFTSQLAKSKQSADAANVRGYYAEVVADALTNDANTYAASYAGPTLNYPSKLTWNGGNSLDVTYSGYKIETLHLTAAAIE